MRAAAGTNVTFVTQTEARDAVRPPHGEVPARAGGDDPLPPQGGARPVARDPRGRRGEDGAPTRRCRGRGTQARHRLQAVDFRRPCLVLAARSPSSQLLAAGGLAACGNHHDKDGEDPAPRPRASTSGRRPEVSGPGLASAQPRRHPGQAHLEGRPRGRAASSSPTRSGSASSSRSRTSRRAAAAGERHRDRRHAGRRVPAGRARRHQPVRLPLDPPVPPATRSRCPTRPRSTRRSRARWCSSSSARVARQPPARAQDRGPTTERTGIIDLDVQRGQPPAGSAGRLEPRGQDLVGDRRGGVAARAGLDEQHADGDARRGGRRVGGEPGVGVRRVVGPAAGTAARRSGLGSIRAARVSATRRCRSCPRRGRRGSAPRRPCRR